MKSSNFLHNFDQVIELVPPVQYVFIRDPLYASAVMCLWLVQRRDHLWIGVNVQYLCPSWRLPRATHTERDVTMKRQLVEDLKTRLKFLQDMEKSYRGQVEDLEKKVPTITRTPQSVEDPISMLMLRYSVWQVVFLSGRRGACVVVICLTSCMCARSKTVVVYWNRYDWKSAIVCRACEEEQEVPWEDNNVPVIHCIPDRIVTSILTCYVCCHYCFPFQLVI